MSKLMLFKINNSHNLTPSRMSNSNKKFKMICRNHRINELSKPKIRGNFDDDYIGPGSYEPKDYYLSTRSKSPTPA